MNMFANAGKYDWDTWLMGIMRSMIGGGSGAVAGLVVTVGTGMKHQLVSMGEAFLIVGIIHMMIFLQTHSGPDVVTAMVTQTTTVSQKTETSSDTKPAA